VVSAEPSYQPSDAEVSPRLRTAFTDVRKRMLPGIIQDQYARAKAAFDQKNFQVAANTFKEMLNTLADPAVGPAASQPPLSDLRTLAVGFNELSVAAIAPPPKPAPAPPPVVALKAPATPPPPTARIYGSQDGDVVPPTIIRQGLPEYDKRLGPPLGLGTLEIVIDETGIVELVLMRGSVHPKYDEIALAAAKTWRYKPATRQGVPVKYSKAIAIAVKL
jgi:TonB family protein